MSRYRIYLLVTIVLGVAIIVGGYLVTIFVRDQIDDNLVTSYGDHEALIAKGVAKSFETEIHGSQSELTLMGQFPQIRDASDAGCNASIKAALISVESKLGNVGRVGADGVFHCSLNPKLLGVKADTLGPYIDTIFNDPAHAPVMSRSIKVPGVDGYAVALHVPVYTPKGAFDGTLGGAIYLTDLQKKYLQTVTFANRGYVILFDDDGTILYHQTATRIGTNALTSTTTAKETVPIFAKMIEQAKTGKSGIIRYRSTTQGDKIAAYEPIPVVPGRTWIALVTVPVADVRGELVGLKVDELLFEVWIILTGIVLLCVFGFILVTRKFVFDPLKVVDQMKSDFVSLVSHQLKTPVAEIKGFVSNMLDGLTGPLNPKQTEYLTDMLNVANKNSKLIDDLLNVSRIERGMLKLNPESLPLAALVNDVLEPLRLVASAKGVHLVEEVPALSVRVMGDAVKTPEALRNIVDNALKFSQPGQTVIVAATEEVDSIVFSVKDEGPGIDFDVQTELFEKNRVWSGKVKASGAGLGLYLSKQFIELLGGSITFTSASGKGTTFFIKLRKA